MRSGQLGIVKVRAFKIGAGEVGAGEIVAFEIDAGEIAARAITAAPGEKIVALARASRLGKRKHCRKRDGKRNGTARDGRAAIRHRRIVRALAGKCHETLWTVGQGRS